MTLLLEVRSRWRGIDLSVLFSVGHPCMPLVSILSKTMTMRTLYLPLQPGNDSKPRGKFG